MRGRRPDTVAERQRRYLKNPINRAKHWLRVAQYQSENPEKSRAKSNAYYRRHREAILDRKRKVNS